MDTWYSERYIEELERKLEYWRSYTERLEQELKDKNYYIQSTVEAVQYALKEIKKQFDEKNKELKRYRKFYETIDKIVRKNINDVCDSNTLFFILKKFEKEGKK